MLGVRFIVLLLSILVSVAAGTLATAAEGEFHPCDVDKDGRISPHELRKIDDLEKILGGHALWLKSRKSQGSRAELDCADLKQVDLSGRKLDEANMRGARLDLADLTKSTLNNAILVGASLYSTKLKSAFLLNTDLTDADIVRADLTGATLNRAIMTRTSLWDSDFTRADLIGTTLKEARFAGSNMTDARMTAAKVHDALWHASVPPSATFFTEVEGLETLTFTPGMAAGLTLLRDALEEVGLRDEERAVTFALERARTEHQLGIWRHSDKTEPTTLLRQIEGGFRYILLEFPVGYGLWPGRAIQILVGLMIAMSIIYWFAIIIPSRHACRASGIYRIAPQKRLTLAADGRPILSDTAKLERLDFEPATAVLYAFYFSLLSAFHFGWRDLNVGTWLTKIQPTEYSLRARGWVRVVSGVQSLLSLYLFAMWVLFYFGRPLQ